MVDLQNVGPRFYFLSFFVLYTPKKQQNNIELTWTSPGKHIFHHFSLKKPSTFGVSTIFEGANYNESIQGLYVPTEGWRTDEALWSLPSGWGKLRGERKELFKVGGPWPYQLL